MSKKIYVARHPGGHFQYIALDVGEKEEDVRADSYNHPDFDRFCGEVGKVRKRGDQLINWAPRYSDEDECDSLRGLEPLETQDMRALEERTDPTIPSVEDLNKMFKL
ncbi:MAG: hypothetical protein NUV97_03115 [archaeon]|nr:hypothetical protein [archaeon]MCR4323560.1 hypothetical protein [Nanoarchaeota archaeon]